MGLKEKLESLEYSEVYDLWIEHVYQSAEPPQLWDLINQLSDLASVDADTAKALSDAIDNLGKEDEPTTPESPIIVIIRGGCIYAVDNVPSDIVVEVRDYDIDFEESDNIKADDDGDKFTLSIY